MLTHHTKDLIAIMIIFTWCVSVFLPDYLIDEVTMRSFERILLLVLGFYFGAKKYETKAKEDITSTDDQEESSQ